MAGGTPCGHLILLLVAALVAMSAPMIQAESTDALAGRVMGLDQAATDYAARYAAAESLSGHMGEETVRALTDWLATSTDPLPAEGAAAVRNETFSRLLRARVAPDDLVRALRVAWEDPNGDEIWQDYCLQHFGSLVPRLDESERSSVVDLLRSALEDRRGALAGTALIALARNADMVAPGEIAEHAAGLAADPARGGGTRATALQVAAELGDRRALEPARTALRDSRSVTLRVSALTVLGRLGDPGDRALVDPFMSNSLPVLRNAAQNASQQMTARFNHPHGEER
jgi:HEAT repeat protein